MSTPEETISVNSPKLSFFRAIVPKTVQNGVRICGRRLPLKRETVKAGYR